MRSAFPTALQLWGPDEASNFLQMSGRMIGMQFFHQTAKGLGNTYAPSAQGFAHFIADLGTAHGDNTRIEKMDGGWRISQDGWVFMQGVAETHPSLANAWNGLIEGALQAHNRRLKLDFQASLVEDRYKLSWLVSE